MKRLDSRLIVFYSLYLVLHYALLVLGLWLDFSVVGQIRVFPFDQLSISVEIYVLAHLVPIASILVFQKRIRNRFVKPKIILSTLAVVVSFYVVHAGLLYLSARLRPDYLLAFDGYALISLFIVFLFIQGLADVPFRVATSYLNQTSNLQYAAVTLGFMQALIVLGSVFVVKGNARYAIVFFAAIQPLLAILTGYLYLTSKNTLFVLLTRTLFFTLIAYALSHYTHDYIPYVIVFILLGASVNALNKNVVYLKLFEPL